MKSDSEVLLLEVGRRQDAKSAKRDRKIVMTDIRRLAQLILDFGEIHGSQILHFRFIGTSQL